MRYFMILTFLSTKFNLIGIDVGKKQQHLFIAKLFAKPGPRDSPSISFHSIAFTSYLMSSNVFLFLSRLLVIIYSRRTANSRTLSHTTTACTVFNLGRFR